MHRAKVSIESGNEQGRLFGMKKRIAFQNNEVVKIEKPSDFAPLGYGDRFIPRRYSRNALSGLSEDGMNDVLMSAMNPSWKRFNFTAVFESIFDIQSKKRSFEWSESRILSFSDDVVRHFTTANYKFYWAPQFNYVLSPKWYKSLDWPCVPRSRTLAFMETVHSLPGFHRSGSKKLIVWNSNNRIVAFVRPEIVTWNPGSSNLMVYSLDNITALSFDQTGQYMAAGGKLSSFFVLELWETKKHNIDLLCIVHMTERSEIRCLAWTIQGHYIVCGQKSGNLTIHRAKNLRSQCKVLPKHHVSAISDIKFSADYKHFTVADEAGVVTIWSWTHGTLQFKLKTPYKTSIHLDWHPWCSTEFVIASRAPASIGIVNTVEKNVVGWYKRCDYKCIIDAISFNKLSGELVVAYRRRAENNEMKIEIVVLASLEHVTDVLQKNKMSRIYHLMWSPDGKTLATAGSHNDLTLWNFFGKSDLALRKCSERIKKNPPKSKDPIHGYFPKDTIK